MSAWLGIEPADGPLVRALPGAVARDALETELVAALAAGPLLLDDLVEQVAERQVRDESERGGWAAEVGVWGPSVYSALVSERIEQADGRLLRVDRPVAVGASRSLAAGLRA